MRNDKTPSPAPTREQYDEIGAAYRYFVVTPVNNGIAYLDMYYLGWADRVVISEFNMRYPDMSILAHVHGVHIDDTSEWQDWSFRTLAAHGFYAPQGDYDDADTLTLRWKTVILNRRQGL